jgi:hypothetical protein
MPRAFGLRQAQPERIPDSLNSIGASPATCRAGAGFLVIAGRRSGRASAATANSLRVISIARMARSNDDHAMNPVVDLDAGAQLVP